MRILSILILTWVVAHLDQVSGKNANRKGPIKGGPCGKPYLKLVNGKCYYVSTKKVNWFGAQNNCLRKTLNLADVGTPGDFKAVTDYLHKEYGSEDYWIGGNDLQKEGQFNYISNGKPVHYMGDSGMVEPTLRSNMDDCLELRIRSNNTVMLDVCCNDEKYFICQDSQLHCVQPKADDKAGDQRHSHEHLHHFHHDAGNKEKSEVGRKAAEGGGAGEGEGTEVESDSRPLDNSNSTEIGTSAEKEAETADQGDETAAGDTTVDDDTTQAAAAANGATTTSPEDTTQAAAAANGATTTSPGDTTQAAAAANGATTTSPGDTTQAAAAADAATTITPRGTTKAAAAA
ncbi:hypothetical protein KR054_001492, partial [Drosophila jambulina]